MAQYALFQLGDGTAAGRQVVSARMLVELHRPEIAAGRGPLLHDIRYALGWYTAEYRGVHLIFHGGAITGFMARNPDQPARHPVCLGTRGAILAPRLGAPFATGTASGQGAMMDQRRSGWR